MSEIKSCISSILNPQNFANFCQRQIITTVVHEISRKINAILIRTIFHGFSWKLFVKCDDLWRKLMAVYGLIHWGKLTLSGRIIDLESFQN